MDINGNSDGCALPRHLQVNPRQTHTPAHEFFIIAHVLLAEPIMKFAISLFSAAHAPSSRRALLFARAALAGGHEIVRLFFYQDGVHSASANIVTPQDEQDVALQWRDFIAEHGLDGVVCIAAALRRGVLDTQEAERYQRPAANLHQPWELSGLGQLHDAVQSADRLVCFGGP
ncbi:tRNA 5-methylaminomethyl-2-thiouridine synthase TusD [Pseudomonas syringae pv. helianthi]|uniref:tRNA 5-methylaminomethyl-2-thiouridine synthase TusD n=4 Tax=Pseudomonas syringae group TaxID=136849 RepID=A0A0P9RB46_9PSED|nr:tRNA 5-methylaminomethyl-2-thiouridine synthase TusD [Pseudomonas syringae pv. helianthi]KPY83121.1 tRNA 5-methylaminomethyl-2-thiouridine synthase TusD [Pseudomonas syringae pv. tagetis]RMV09880.1 tRNA 5-methylaminomethyl-2-thiouridine synthase TusD [Pseudomonas savastanoi]RMR08951.1 tRNA 5-methylaminomethyl-2-thiouridine synthase TusD [Pseudomonas syringae pv. helianthi]RMV47265.1 tRNA 5-methylaminomethyl-2-thiouridine synthase TusD [Pseudomonas syringae pv. helianthi]